MDRYLLNRRHLILQHLQKIPASSKDSEISPKLSIERYGANYRPTLLRAINRGLKLKPSERFGSADEFAAALLEGSKWISLLDYEIDVMAYDRFESSIKHAQEDIISFAA